MNRKTRIVWAVAILLIVFVFVFLPMPVPPETIEWMPFWSISPWKDARLDLVALEVGIIIGLALAATLLFWGKPKQ